MKRLAFNGGEISPAMALRADMDVYARSCSELTNFDVAATGGISRRRGMRHVDEAMEGYSRLIPYTYSGEIVYLVELSANRLQVRDGHSPFDVVAAFDGGEDWSYSDLDRVTWLQINSLLLICSSSCLLMQLKMDAGGQWSFVPYEFKCPPWQTSDLRDREVTVKPTDGGGIYSVEFDAEEEEDETEPDAGDLLRASYYTTRAEAFETSSQLRGGDWFTFGPGSSGITPASSHAVGDRLAVASDLVHECFVCIADWQGVSDFTQGCSSPANYKENFLRAEDLTGFDDVDAIFELSSGQTYKRGDKVRIKSGYWSLYTCIREFSPEDYVAGYSSPADYSSHFVRGCPVGDALPCKGTWKFYCSGTWYGSYEVRRSYDSGDHTASWETLGESISYIGSPENNIVTGTEEKEECFLRLYLTSIRYKGASLAAGWPPDECSNRLIVSAYKHDMLLRVAADGFYQDRSAVPVQLSSPLVTDDWSWGAFNSRYGYASLAELHESRLVLASTARQPQTIWMSRVDDLDNFDDSETDDSSLMLTMSTSTQAAICWLYSRGDDFLLGTEDGEWVIPGNGSGLAAKTARIVNYGRTGSAHIPVIQAQDRVLYCERGSGRVYQYGYNDEMRGYRSEDLTIFADHIAKDAGGIVSGTLQRKPYCVASFVLADGTMALMTYNTFHNVNAWHRYVTAGRIESACVLPNGNNADRMFLLVNREGGRRLEVMDEDSPYFDSDGLDYVSTMETTAFSSMEYNERKAPSSVMHAYIAMDTPADNIAVATAKTEYVGISYTGVIRPGWVQMVANAGWSDRTRIGIKVKGDAPFSLLAVQL